MTRRSRADQRQAPERQASPKGTSCATRTSAPVRRAPSSAPTQAPPVRRQPAASRGGVLASRSRTCWLVRQPSASRSLHRGRAAAARPRECSAATVRPASRPRVDVAADAASGTARTPESARAPPSRATRPPRPARDRAMLPPDRATPTLWCPEANPASTGGGAFCPGQAERRRAPGPGRPEISRVADRRWPSAHSTTCASGAPQSRCTKVSGGPSAGAMYRSPHAAMASSTG